METVDFFALFTRLRRLRFNWVTLFNHDIVRGFYTVI